ncbi:MAG: hypothetical protein IPM47_18990 [Sphingobacteriales bacterium]|nr:MAG: hypothetical protein IPM47_18990 [Sphingobacteriales bacterium]
MKCPAGNSTFAIGGVSCFADSLVVAESFALRINIGGKNPAHLKSAKRYALCYVNFDNIKNECKKRNY